MKIDIIWFRRDLRIHDNPILSHAELPVMPIFIFDTNILSELPKDDRRVTFIFDKVIELKKSLKKIGFDLAIFYGKPSDVFDYISKKYEIRKIFASGDNDSYARSRDKEIASKYNFVLVHDNFLLRPHEILNSKGETYKIFSHFEKAVLDAVPTLANVKYLPEFKSKLVDFEYSNILKINNVVELLPLELESIGFERQELVFEGAVKSAEELLRRFERYINSYGEQRDYPALNATSLLSVHLRFGTISIREVFRWALTYDKSGKFISELIWREFFNYILYHHPEIEFDNFRKDVIANWENNEEKFELWKKGLTGIPLVDAGMRQLEMEGYMHNRVRMVVASFLTKNLHIDWRFGEKYFAMKLLDYEASSNVGNWQWNAGTGTDTKLRFFNPFLQSKKFDPSGEYIKKYVPELRHIKIEHLHDENFFLNEKIEGYPKPIVNLKESVARFKEIYKRQDVMRR